jgi:hypothetical protein
LALVAVAAAAGRFHRANCLSHLFARLEQPVWELMVAIEQEAAHSKASEGLKKSMIFMDPLHSAITSFVASF